MNDTLVPSSQVTLMQCERYYKQQQTDNNNDCNVDMSARFFPIRTTTKQAVPITQPIIKVEGNYSRTLTWHNKLKHNKELHPTNKR